MPLPALLEELGQTWKDLHPDWQYILWDDAAMEDFLRSNYAQYADTYHAYPYDAQRWDAIRYLILYKMGGLYVDMDYECFKRLDPLLDGHVCCMGLEPTEHARQFKLPYIVGNALMAAIPGHRYFKMIIDAIFAVQEAPVSPVQYKPRYVIETTGTLMTTRMYDAYPFKDEIALLPAEQIAPLTMEEVRSLIDGCETSDIEEKAEKAFAAHYFLGLWYPL